jgi:putative peptidoglycan lipid II flippase
MVLIGFATQSIAAALFGAGAEMDAYLAANTLPNYLYAVLLSALSVVVVPVLIATYAKNREETWLIASSLLNLFALSLGVLALLGVLFARQWLIWTAPGLPEETLNLATRIAEISWFSVITMCLTRLLVAIHHSQYSFEWPAMISVIGGVAILLLTVGVKPVWGIQGWAVATLVGGVLQIVLLLPIIVRKGRYTFQFGLNVSGVGETLGLMAPLVFGNMINRTPLLVDRFVASGLGVGSIAYLGYANKTVTVLSTLLTTGIATTAFPVMAEDAANQNMIGLRRTMSLSIRVIWVAVAPVVTMMTALSLPLVTLLFRRGEFSSADAMALATVLPWYLLAMIGMSLGDIVSRGFYALKDTRTLAILGVVEAVAYAICAGFLGRMFGYVGIGVAAFLDFNLSLLAISLIMRYKTGGGGMGVVQSLIRTGCVAICGGMVAFGVMLLLGQENLLSLPLGSIAGAAIYALLMNKLGAEEWTILVSFMLGTWSKLKGRPRSRSQV